MTNFDRIKQMNIEEMANEIVSQVVNTECCNDCKYKYFKCNSPDYHIFVQREWKNGLKVRSMKMTNEDIIELFAELTSLVKRQQSEIEELYQIIIDFFDLSGENKNPTRDISLYPWLNNYIKEKGNRNDKA